jgi:hypothetical protein
MKGITTEEWKIRNYLNKHNIYKDDGGMQQIIINSFYNERGGDNESEWKEKLNYVHNHFGLFAQYAQNNWKQK